MVKYTPNTLDATFHALADPTRRAILASLGKTEKPLTISELAKPHAMSLPAISKHVSVLEQAGLVTRIRRGRQQYVQIIPEPVNLANSWLEEHLAYWHNQINRLENYLRKD